MVKRLELAHERVDDIPLLLGMEKQLGLPELLDRWLGNHGLHQGLSDGWLGSVWLAFILSEGDHRKSTVRDWAERHRQTLESLLGQTIRSVEFDDDRLGIVLHRLSRPASWEGLEAELWARTMAVHELGMTGVRLDSTTVAGYHSPTPDGLMQLGYSKDHRPDLTQLKLMAAAVEPSGHLVACDVLPGQSDDQPLYQPLVARVRQMLGRSGLLYAGDCKMAALDTRADIAAHGDYYVMPLPISGQTEAQFGAWVGAVVEEEGKESVELIWDGDRTGDSARLLGAGYEFERRLRAEIAGDCAARGAPRAGKTIEWTERVEVIRSRELADRQAEQLEQRLTKATAALRALAPEPGRGKRVWHDESSLIDAIAEVQTKYRVDGLLRVSWREEAEHRHRYPSHRQAPLDAPKQIESASHGEVASPVLRVRYIISDVQPDEAAIQRHRHRFGWRIQATNAPTKQLSLTQAVIHYRGGWSLERDFHLVKDRPVGISPLYVRNDDQIIGLTRLLSLALRLMTLIETQVRLGLAKTKGTLAGLYEGQANRTTDKPTATRLLRAFARAEITLTRAELGDQSFLHITPLTNLLERIVDYLGLPKSLYESLAENSP